MQQASILALDQGTTSSRAIVFSADGGVQGQASVELRQIYPQPGWVEHDPEEIFAGQVEAARQAIGAAGIRPSAIAGIGITNQRETTVLWERDTGRPIGNAIVWQCRRSAAICAELRAAGAGEMVRRRTGLLLDPYFSGSKLRWLLEADPELRRRAERGEILFGTVDSWLIYRLTGGRVHATDPSNASRTLLYDIREGAWADELLEMFRVPRAMLPEVRPSAGSFGRTELHILGVSLPIAGVLGDQQASLFGQACFEPGDVKNTYGTGCFLLMQTGRRPVPSRHGLITTIAWEIGGEVRYALEGSVFVAGAAIQWLRDELGLIRDAAESEAIARSIPGTGGVYLVPAFTGLGAPHWDARARGALLGLTRGSGRAEIVRAALESIAYQVADVLSAMRADLGAEVGTLRVDGGAARNDFLLEFQADVAGTRVLRGPLQETTALGAARIAGLSLGVYRDLAEIRALTTSGTVFDPGMAEPDRRARMQGWHRAVERARGWATE